MGTGYVRNDTSNSIVDEGVIDAADLDGEFDAVVAAFVNTTGHTHDGTVAEGGAVLVLGPAQDLVADSSTFFPKANGTYDLGKTGARFKVGYIDDLVVSGDVDGRDVSVDGTKLDGIESSATADQTGSQIKTAYENESDTNAYDDAAVSKLGAIESGADVTDTTNVQAAGALMDSELAGLAAVKATTGTFLTSDQNKLNGIESSATADQTGSQIKTAYEGESDTNAYDDDAVTKLSGIESSADVTNTTNVTSSGALMDSELSSIASVKALNQGVSTGDKPSFDGFTSTGDSEVSGNLIVNKDSQSGFFLSPGDTGHTLLFARSADDTFGIYDDLNNRTWFRHVGNSTVTEQTLSILEGGGELVVGDVSDSFPSNNTSGAGFAMSTDGRCGFINSVSAVNVGRHTTVGNVVQFYYSSSFAGSISVTASATAYNTSSDYRLKENITSIQGAADIVLSMQPCTYTAIADGLWYDGFLAHELQKVHPRAVQGAKDAMRDEEYEVTPATETKAAVMGVRSVPDMQSVDYSKLTPILTAALQEALTKITDLEKRLSALEA